MKTQAKILVIPLAAIALSGCEAVAVANVIGSILSPAPVKFAPAQNGPFRARTAGEDMSPVLNEVTDAKTTSACRKNLKKLAEAGEDTLASQLPTDERSAREDEAQPVANTADASSPSETGACMRKWVCLPAQDYPLLTTFCPGLDVVEHETAKEARVRNSEWTWDWN